MNTWNIKAAPPRIGRVDLCGLDMTGCRYFDAVAFFDGSLDVERLRESLTRAVTRYPVLAGTLAREERRLYIDLNGPGVPFHYEEVNVACPPFGPDIAQVNIPQLFAPIAARGPQPEDPRPLGKPLVLMKLTRFADGRYALGISTCHMMCDGRGVGRWINDWDRYYSGEEISDSAEFTRDRIVALADPAAGTPSANSGLLNRTVSAEEIRDRLFDPRYTILPVTLEQRTALVALAANHRGAGLSEHAFLHALLLKSFAHACPPTLTHVAAVLPYDLRLIKGLDMPANYCGNATVQRLLRLPRAAVIDAAYLDLAAKMLEVTKPDPASARQDIGFRHGEYVAGRMTDYGTLTNVQLALARDTIMISNMAQASRHMDSPFGGSFVWTDMAINQPLPVRSAWIHASPSRSPGYRITLILPEEQVTPFLAAWEMGMAELSRHPVARRSAAAH
jgi:hypothetical protein